MRILCESGNDNENLAESRCLVSIQKLTAKHTMMYTLINFLLSFLYEKSFFSKHQSGDGIKLPHELLHIQQMNGL